MDSMKCVNMLVYIDTENVSVEELNTLFCDTLHDENIKLLGIKAYGNIAVLGSKYSICIENGAEFINTSLIGQTRKNLADVKLVVDCLFDVMTRKHVDNVFIVSSDNDFLPLVYKLKSIGVSVRTLISTNKSIDKLKVKQLVTFCKNVGVFPMKGDIALGQAFDTIVSATKGYYTERDICDFYKLRLIALSRKLKSFGYLDIAQMVPDMNARTLSFSKFVEATGLTGKIEMNELKNLYTYQLFGVAAPVA